MPTRDCIDSVAAQRPHPLQFINTKQIKALLFPVAANTLPSLLLPRQLCSESQHLWQADAHLHTETDVDATVLFT